MIDQKKAEGQLEQKFCQLFNSNHKLDNSIYYEFFDFHKECSKMRYERLSLLMDRLAKYDLSYLLAEKDATNGPIQLQVKQWQSKIQYVNGLKAAIQNPDLAFVQ